MKKILFILMLVITWSTYSQVKPARHTSGASIGDPSGTSSDPANLETPEGLGTYYWNATLKRFRLWNGTDWSDFVDQDNIPRFDSFVVDDFQISTLVTAVNGLPSFSIGEKDVYFFEAMSEDGILIFMLKDLGKGDYGTGNTQITESDINVLSLLPLSITDMINLPTTQFIDLGDIGLNDIQDGFNAYTFTGSEDPIQNQNEGYVIVEAIQDGSTVQYLFVGSGGEYGTGGSLTAIEEDFTLLEMMLPVRDIWRDRDGNNIAFSYNQWISHEGHVNLGGDLHVSGVLNGGYGTASRLQIGGNYGADFIGGNNNHSVYRFIQPAPSSSFPAGRDFENVIIGRDFSFASGTGAVQNYSLQISPTVDLSNTDAASSSHKSIYINPSYSNMGSADLHAIYSEVGDVHFANGDLYLPDITSGTAVNNLGIDASGKVIPVALGGGGSSDDIPLAGTNVGEPVTGNIEISSTTVSNDGWYLLYGDFDSTDLDYGYFGFVDDGSVRIERKLNNDQSSLEIFPESVTLNRIDNVSGDSQILILGEQVSGEIRLTDLIKSKGLVGESYYGANYDDNTYTQKKYVDDEIAAASLGGGTDDQTAAEVTSDDATFDVISGTDVQANLVSADNELYELTPETEATANASALTLKTGGKNYNILTAESANTNTAFTITNSVYRPNQYARVKINVSSQPTFPAGVNQEGGVPFQADTDLYMIVWSKGTSVNDVVYFFISEAVSPSYNYTLPTSDGSADQILVTDGSGTVTWEDAPSGSGTITDVYRIYLSDATSDVVTGTGLGGHERVLFGGTLVDAYVSMDDGGTVQGIEVDLLKDGVSVLSTNITTDATEDFSEDATTPPVFSDTTMPFGAKLTANVDQAPTGAKNAILYVIIERL